MRIALVHEYLVVQGGAEKVFFALLKLFPKADVFTSIHDPKVIKLPKRTKVYTSFIQYLPFAKKKRHLYFALMPKAFEMFDFSDYDLVISDSHSFAKGIKVPKNVFHFCYCHTPTRYFWLNPKKHISDSHYHPLIKKIIPKIIEKLKKWDFGVAQRPNIIVANSLQVAKRIKRFYKRIAEVIYPPVEFGKALKVKAGDYFVLISRLEPHKKVDIACKAFAQIPREKLIVIGTGTQEQKLKKMASENITFTGFVSDAKKWQLLAGAKGFIFPQEEDFGITAIEAQMMGVPVIAYNAGGAPEIVKDGKTGILFPRQTPKSLLEAIEKFKKTSYDKKLIRKHAQSFSQTIFLKKIKKYITSSFETWKRGEGIL